LTGLRKSLNDAGFIEGRNLSIEIREADRNDQLPALAAELVRQRVAVIGAVGVPPALAAKMATATIPIVFFAGDDPVRAGLVTSLSRPSGNLTGVTDLSTPLLLKRLGLLRELLLAAFAMSHALPTIYYSARFVTAGGLMSYASSAGQIYPRPIQQRSATGRFLALKKTSRGVR
jgi:putative ABC transport system substrate-binding protein